MAKKFTRGKPKTFKTPKSLVKHQPKYRVGAWMEYSETELANIIAYKAKLATHRISTSDALKLLNDARNYCDMLEVKIRG